MLSQHLTAAGGGQQQQQTPSKHSVLERQETAAAGESDVRPAPGGGPGTITVLDNRTGKKYTVRHRREGDEEWQLSNLARACTNASVRCGLSVYPTVCAQRRRTMFNTHISSALSGSVDTLPARNNTPSVSPNAHTVSLDSLRCQRAAPSTHRHSRRSQLGVME